MTLRLKFILACALQVSCGDSTTAPNGEGGEAGPYDFWSDIAELPMQGPDLAYFHEVDGGGVRCVNMACAPGQICCEVGGMSGSPTGNCAASCGDGGAPIQCNGPAQCGGSPCCLHVFHDYFIESATCTNAPSACPGNADIAMNMMQTRGCKYDGDCTDGLSSMIVFPTCCHLTGTTTRLCYNKNITNTYGGTVTCP